MNADPIAAIYRYLEAVAFQGRLQRCRETYLNAVTHAKRILILGEGDGRFLARLVAQNPTSQIDVVEASGKMIALARNRIPSSRLHNINFYRQDARISLLPGSGYDVIVTNFFLDCFSDAEAAAIVTNAAEALRPGGIWIVGDFQQPSEGIAALHAWLWLRVMYFAFRLTTGLRVASLPSIETILASNGLVALQRQQDWSSLLTAQLWQKPLARSSSLDQSQQE